MTCNIYALLVGINNYPLPVPPLKGCVNDVTEVEAYLRGRIANNEYKLHLLKLQNQEATRQAIINGFRQHLCQAGSNDVALFYYSGHGSQAQTPPEWWHLEPDHLNETLVCWDSRISGCWDLADKELAKLIAEVANKNPHITIILDCCHSGSGTRDSQLETAVRWVPVDERQRPLNSFIVSLEEAFELAALSRSELENTTGWNLPQDQHILLAACRDSEKAKEFYANGQVRGVFCFFLLETLKRANRNLTYRDLFKRTNAMVRSKIADQSPQMEAKDWRDLDRPFLGGAITQLNPYFTVYFHRQYNWVIDGGAVHGMPLPAKGETTLLALFLFDSPPKELQQLSAAIGEAQVLEVMPQLSKIEINGIGDLNPDITFKAVVTSLPLPPKDVYLEGDAEGLQRLRQALLQATSESQPSLYVREGVGKEVAEFRVVACKGQYFITRTMNDRPLVTEAERYTKESAALVVRQLEHIVRWINIVELASPANNLIPTDAVKIEIYQGEEVLQDAQTRLEYRQDTSGRWKQPSFHIKLTNTSNQTLYCALLNLTERYTVKADFFESGGVWLKPGEEAWAANKQPLYASVPQKLWQQGITECKDIFKIIVSTAEFDATLLQQESLDLPRPLEVSRQQGMQRKSTLNRLMHRLQSREISIHPEAEELYDHWVGDQITITTVRPINIK